MKVGDLVRYIDLGGEELGLGVVVKIKTQVAFDTQIPLFYVRWPAPETAHTVNGLIAHRDRELEVLSECR
jgi:hypothetical protein